MYILYYLDINECTRVFKICSKLTNSYCFNNNGSYECKCNTGYEKINDRCEGYNIAKYLYYILFFIYYTIYTILYYVSIIIFLRMYY